MKKVPKRLRQYYSLTGRYAPMFQFSALAAMQHSTEVIAVTTSFVLAPAAYWYVMDVLTKAMADGKQRLYFLARDAYLFYQIAVYLCEQLSLPIECRYLYCSRYALRIPLFHRDLQEAMTYICRGGIDVTMEKILNRAALTEAEQQEVMRELSICDKDAIISYADLPAVQDKLLASELFLRYLEEHSRAAVPALEGYLRQEGLLDAVPMAIVDSGWVGSMQKVLSQALRELGRTEPLEGYYWGLYELPDAVDPSTYHCSYFSPGTGLEEKVYFSNCLFEVVFSAPYGMTTGYRQVHGIWVPIHETADTQNNRLILQSETYYLRYAEAMTKQLTSVSDYPLEQGRKLSFRLMKAFMSAPSPEEAERYGGIAFSDDVTDTEDQQLARPMTQKELQQNHLVPKVLALSGLGSREIRESAWYEGSAVRNGENVPYHLFHYRQYKRLLYQRKTYQWRNQYGKSKSQ